MGSDLERLADQQRRLQFTTFDEETAWLVGTRLRQLAATRGHAVTIEVRLGGHTVFLSAMVGTSPANADWARRKRNVVEMLGRSSYAVGLDSARRGQSLLDDMGLSARDHAMHGGAVPAVVDGVGCVGVVTVSGLPQRDDHELVVEVFAEMCGVDHADVRLPPDA